MLRSFSTHGPLLDQVPTNNFASAPAEMGHNRAAFCDGHAGRVEDRPRDSALLLSAPGRFYETG